jgi:hypothetical protein
MRVRLHRAFLYAPDSVIAGLGRWLAGRERSCPAVVQRFIDRPPRRLRRVVRPAPPPLRARGRHYDLQAVFDRVNRVYCGGTLRVRITWGRRGPLRAVRARTLGAYYHRERLIVINPVLDQPAVPRWFLAFTVFHECLHALQPHDERPHGDWFARAERRHRRYRDAQQWEQRHIRLLTGSGREPPRRAVHADRPVTQGRRLWRRAGSVVRRRGAR